MVASFRARIVSRETDNYLLCFSWCAYAIVVLKKHFFLFFVVSVFVFFIIFHYIFFLLCLFVLSSLLVRVRAMFCLINQICFLSRVQFAA